MRPHRRILAVAVAVLPLALASCRSPEQKLVDARRELRDTLDALHAAYGAGAAGGATGGAGGEAPPEGGLVGRMLGEVGRTYLEQSCLAVGRGERPFALSGRLEAFLAEPANARACRHAADLQLEVDALEREVAARR